MTKEYTLQNWLRDVLDNPAPSMESTEYHNLLPAIVIAAAIDDASQRIAEAIANNDFIRVEQV